MTASPDAALWEEVCIITDHCLHLHEMAIHGRTMGLMVLQERARWLNLTLLSTKEKEDFLDTPITPQGLRQLAFPPPSGSRDNRKYNQLLRHHRNPLPPRHSGRGPATSHLHSGGKEEEAVGLTSSLDGGSEQGSLPSMALFPSPFEEFSRVQCMTERTFEPAQHATKKLRDCVHYGEFHSDPRSRHTSTFFCSTEINFHKLSHPGHESRAQLKTLKNINALTLGDLVPPFSEGVRPLPSVSSSVAQPIPRACALQDGAFCDLAPEGYALSPFSTDWPVSRLTVKISLWEKCTDSEWVLRTIRRGYRLQFTVSPTCFRGVIQSQAEGEATLFLQEEISSTAPISGPVHTRGLQLSSPFQDPLLHHGICSAPGAGCSHYPTL
ncbi:hypothetical protein XENOCAPTIV_021463 [Xenoophorus captivus]|uniref:Uncharacterized protein n=1 Tax=Xenoophorus captivus TaxID=1517983 RepID=A0ABV0QDZ5_9TELE